MEIKAHRQEHHDAPAIGGSRVDTVFPWVTFAGRLTVFFAAASIRAIKLLSRSAAKAVRNCNVIWLILHLSGGKRFVGFLEVVARGLRCDRGALFISAASQWEIRFLGVECSPAFLREPECNGSAERAFRALDEPLLSCRYIENLVELEGALREFRDRCSQHWPVKRLRDQSPRQARSQLPAIEAAA